MSGGLQPLTIAIPACNAAATLPHCLAAIAKQTGLDARQPLVVVLANDCTDETAAIARAAANDIDIICHETDMPRTRAHAGWARRLAMEMAADLTSDGGIIVSTDADAVADPDWLEALMQALRPGVAAVAGRVSRSGNERTVAAGNLEQRYLAASAEIEALIDPVVEGLWPRHNLRSGANFAVRRAAWALAGGVPPLAVGEDWAFLDEVERGGGVIRHALCPHVRTSGEALPRLVPGMARGLAPVVIDPASLRREVERLEMRVERLRR